MKTNNSTRIVRNRPNARAPYVIPPHTRTLKHIAPLLILLACLVSACSGSGASTGSDAEDKTKSVYFLYDETLGEVERRNVANSIAYWPVVLVARPNDTIRFDNTFITETTYVCFDDDDYFRGVNGRIIELPAGKAPTYTFSNDVKRRGHIALSFQVSSNRNTVCRNFRDKLPSSPCIIVE